MTFLQGRKKVLILLVVDIILLIASVGVSATIFMPKAKNVLTYFTGPIVFLLVTTLTILYAFGMYDFGRAGIKKLSNTGDIILKTFFSVILSNIFLASIFFILNHWFFPRPIFFLQLMISIILLIMSRLVLGATVKHIPISDKYVIIGNPKEHKWITDLLGKHFAGFAGDPNVNKNDDYYLGEINSIKEILKKHHSNKIILALDDQTIKKYSELFISLRISGVNIYDIQSIYELFLKRVPVHHIHDYWLLMQPGFSIYHDDFRQNSKRILDLLITLFALVCVSPIMLFTAIIIKLTSKGDIIFKQERIGENDQIFTLYKFRSMNADSEKDGPKWAEKEDPRITFFGKFIRKTRIDELPQLWNVIKGEMSIVGPRPEQVQFVYELEKKIPYYYMRHTVKPGITGWAQIMYPYGATEEDALHKLEYELFYIKNMSILFDIKIMIRTVGVMLFKQGSR